MPNEPVSPLQCTFCGLVLNSPIVLLSGCVGFGEEYTRLEGFSLARVGAVCLKGTTLEPRLGNSPHRLWETASGYLNAIGLQNPGVDAVVKTILPSLDFSETRYVANVSGSTVEEYAEVSRRFDDSPIDALEINISCPNVREGGVQFGNDPDMSARVIAACRSMTRKPLIAKLSPNQTDIRANARRCIEAGADGLAVINTVTGLAIDRVRRTALPSYGQGGLSGPAIKPIALLKVAEVAEIAAPLGVPIIGQGGITTTEDAVDFLIAGASLIGLGTGLFYNPLLANEIHDGLLAYLSAGHLSLRELVGSLRRG
jgi:dihydroorotate dehydrogenase (NAD+) catalytic subunit